MKLIHASLSVLLAAIPLATAAAPALSPEAEALIAPVHAAYERVDGLIALLPPPGDETEELIRMQSIDQAGRDALEFIDLNTLAEDERAAASSAVWDEIHRRDLDVQARLKEMRPAEGWFRISDYTDQGALAAFLIVQHAENDPEFQRDVLAAMEPLFGTEELDGRAYALLYDPIAMEDGRYQRFGGQMICMDNRWVLYPIEDPEGADARRRQAGFDLTLDENTARYAERPPCGEDYSGPLPG